MKLDHLTTSCILSELNKLIFKRLQASLENKYGTCQKHSLASGTVLGTEHVLALCVKLTGRLALTLKLLLVTVLESSSLPV